MSAAPNYYHDEAVYKKYGISNRKEPQIDERTGEPRKNRDGSIRMQTIWTETPEQWATVTQKEVWKDYPTGIVPAAINVHNHFTHLDEEGNEAKWTGSHWTGHHMWAPYRGSAVHQYKALAKAFNDVVEPIVRKDQVKSRECLQAEDPQAKGLYLFASNWTLPDEPELFTKRIPQGFFKSMVKPVVCKLAESKGWCHL